MGQPGLLSDLVSHRVAWLAWPGDNLQQTAEMVIHLLTKWLTSCFPIHVEPLKLGLCGKPLAFHAPRWSGRNAGAHMLVAWNYFAPEFQVI